MRQVLQRLGDGEILLDEVPTPHPGRNQLVVATTRSLVSAGTERMLVEFGRAGWLEKARQHPERVRQVISKAMTDGVGPTLDAVRSKLSDPIPLGYCQAGRVVAVGPGVTRFRPGDRVATNGPHAEMVRVTQTLAARVPDSVPDEAACFTPVAAVGLQGIRLVAPTLGETVVVFGLGLIGLLTVQMLRASGCRVIGLDRQADRLRLAEGFGARAIDVSVGDPTGAVIELTGGAGADAVIMTLASSTDEPVNQAAAMSRKRGRVVLVGVTGLSLSREEFFRKELSFSVSCSYGPGRYDPEHEELGHDYPLPYVRWTEGRNFEAVLQLMAAGQLTPTPLITHRFPIGDARRAYDVIAGGEPSLGVVLEYPEHVAPTPEPLRRSASRVGASDTIVAGVIGAGNFARRTLLPVLREAGVRIKTVVSPGATSAALTAREFGIEQASGDPAQVLDDPAVNAIFVLTRHDSHAALAAAGLVKGKHVFVEKPLGLRQTEIDQVETAAKTSDRLLLVGFNRRFAPIATEMRRLMVTRVGPCSIQITVNAGAVPANHWTRNPEVGGGRFLGEGCHFVDLARFLAGSPISGVSSAGARERSGRASDDVVSALIAFADGSQATILYSSQGATSYPKEEVRVFFDGVTLVNENWRRLRRFGTGRAIWSPKRRQNKGHSAEIAAWLDAIRSGGASPIALTELLEVSRWSITAGEQAAGLVAP